ncbi:Probable tRNA N6-adenosine threonylcarbamoyltransferase [Durusdinium trenchii]|uniref:Mitochondrial (N6-L-threonylcarbamoyladenine synthase) (T(6)A synthase) (T(6)A37 threonylcarbamoyladenosine biosynthesis protein GCP1) (tRNA threonylcarbamoyladenosine biosynthesis protein GCP1) n=1 Tax=Durusdinium trenchii TaxID=1381693 RepID=A0ABP0HP10_9DINO
MAPKQAEGMRALAELAHTYNLFIDRPVSCLWLLDNAIACKFRSLAASAVQRRVAGKDWIRNPRVIACHKALEHFQLANYCELTCKLCGLEGFWGSLDMAEHLASNGHELQRWYLTLAEGKKASPLPAEAALARQWLELGMQKWPKNDGTLFHVNHLDFHVDVKVPDLAEAYQPANASYGPKCGQPRQQGCLAAAPTRSVKARICTFLSPLEDAYTTKQSPRTMRTVVKGDYVSQRREPRRLSDSRKRSGDRVRDRRADERERRIPDQNRHERHSYSPIQEREARETIASRRDIREKPRENGTRQTDSAFGRRDSRELKRSQGGGARDAKSPARKAADGKSSQKEVSDSIKPIWTCKQCKTSMFGHLQECSNCRVAKPELDLRFVQVWNVPPDVAKKTLQWFQKKAGGADAEMAPIGAQLVTAAEMQTAILEMRDIPQAEKMVAAIEKWKVGIPKMKAKVMSQEEFENFLEKSKTCLVFVKNLPEDIEDPTDIKNMGKNIEKATTLSHKEFRMNR